MKVYRCCGDDEIKAYKNGIKFIKSFGDGTNTFTYQKDKKYIHFFLFAESMVHYAKYKGGRSTKNFMECDIPFEILEKYYGYGWYESILSGYYFPVPEFAIPIEEFDINFISKVFFEPKSEWLRPEEWNQYVNSVPYEYLAHVFRGGFVTPGFTERSILDIPVERLIGHMFQDSPKK